MDLSGIKALTFDVGGTVFDWRGTIEDELRILSATKSVDVDISQFATDWRSGMFQMLARVRSGELPWLNADQMHRRALDNVLTAHASLSLSGPERDQLNEVWHRLRAWPDARGAIEKLRDRYIVTVLTVLSYSIAVDSSKHNGIDWDGILSCEFLGHYKPDPEAYQKAVKLLALEPEEVMMVAAHGGDLQGAIGAGLHSAYVHREDDWYRSYPTDEPTSPLSTFDLSADNFDELAEKLLS